MFRPQTLNEFVGQAEAVLQVKMLVAATKRRGQVLPHVLITGPSGTGKTTLAKILASELEARVVVTTPAAVRTNSDLFSMFVANMKSSNDPPLIVFMDEVHKLGAGLQEDLYLPMEDQILVKRGLANMKYQLDPWTLIAATTAPGALEEPFRNRFGLQIHMRPYTVEEMCVLIKQSSEKTGYKITDDGVVEIAQRSRMNPRVANSYVDRCIDCALVHAYREIDGACVLEAFSVLGIDDFGLNPTDRKYLQTLYKTDRPVGVKSLEPILHTDAQTITNSIEPYLVEAGFVTLTPRGRQLTQRGVDLVEDKSVKTIRDS